MNAGTIKIPEEYLAGYDRAHARDAEFAEAYVRHTTIGDPIGDETAADLAEFPAQRVHEIIARAMADPAKLPPEAPASLGRFMEESMEVPVWFDEEATRISSRAFLRNSDVVLAALVAGSIVEGFATLISKSFRIRGRVTSMGVRRLKQNGLHLLESYLPGGVLPLSDGWRLSLRIRLVHARSRRLIRESEEWEEERHGLPVSAATLSLAAAAFSGRLMQHVATLGGDFSREEREAYVHVWRYSALLLGIPQEVIFRDEAGALSNFDVAKLCEPPPGDDAIIMANSIINSAPIVIGVTESEERRKIAALAYRISRGLIGGTLADALRYPGKGDGLAVQGFAFRNRLARAAFGVIPAIRKNRELNRTNQLMDFVDLGQTELSYALPTTTHDEESSDW